MRKPVVYIPFILQFMATLLILSVVGVSSSGLPSGEYGKQWLWIAHCGLFYVVCVGLSLFFYTRIKEAERPGYTCIVAWSLILWGGWEAVLGLRQLYGFAYSNHSLFALTGSFFNPGPYSGYLAMIFPLCLHEYYRLKESSRASLPAKVGYYVTIAISLCILCVLPAGMSRSAWLAAGISGLFVAGWHNNGLEKLKTLWKKNRKMMLSATISGCVCLLIALTAIFYLKEDSASGRLFMWRMELKAIAGSPWTGHGVGSFPVAYGRVQEDYFAEGEYAVWEEHVAGSPEYAFNEYLQIAIEWGVPALLLCLAAVGFCFWQALKKHRIGICGGIVSLAVFAFSSYPLRLPVFIVTFAVLLLAGVVGRHRLWLLSFAVGAGLCSLYLWTNNHCDAGKKWAQIRVFYNTGAYGQAKKEYASLYPELKNNREFMFEYGRCLHQLGEYDASSQILQETSLLTCDPMVFNIMAKNYQMKGEYEKAEECLLRSVNRLPGRIYPYYLLTKLYAEPDFYQQDKFERAARMVMEKEPKVQSTAIKEMREEIRKMVQDVIK